MSLSHPLFVATVFVLLLHTISGWSRSHDGIVDRRQALLNTLAQASALTSSAAAAAAAGASPAPSFSVETLPEDRRSFLTPPKQLQSPLLNSIPRVGYSFYKTPPEQAERCLEVALTAGVRYFDVATQYSSNEIIGRALQPYLLRGFPNDDTNDNTSRRLRRRSLFISHKVSNNEQSSDRRRVRRAVLEQLRKLKVGYLDLCSIHSPLTAHRLPTYETLLDLQTEGIVKHVGVCNYGVKPLDEIVEAGLPPPAMIQLVLSPFNQHQDVAAWARQHGSLLGCNAWSKLSSVQGPQEGWAVVSDIAKNQGKTKAQILVRWSFQKGFVCVPRSASKSKVERLAIAENSYRGIRDWSLGEKEMAALDGLEEHLPVGQLGITDGWEPEDIVDARWDPVG